MSKILVTGGAGFIASHIVDAYIAAGHEVAIIDNLSTGKKEHINPKTKLHQIDLREQDKVKEVIGAEKPEIINHHAAQKSVAHSVQDPAADADINIIGLLNLMEASRQNGVKKVIFASTGGAIYGDTETIPTPETTRELPTSPYGIAKLSSEHYLRYYQQIYNIETICLRYSNVYGPRQDPYGEAGVVAIFAKKLLGGETPTIFGDGGNKRDYVFIKDVVAANLKALTAAAPAPDQAGINIGTGRETDVNQIFAMLQKAVTESGKVAQVPPKPEYAAARPGEQRRSALDCQLAQKILGWQPAITLEEGMKQTVEFFASAPK